MGLVHTDIDSTVERVCRRIAGVTRNSLSLVTASSGVRVNTRIQTLFSLRFSRPADQVIYETMLSHALKAEQVGSGGFDLCIDHLVNIVLNRKDGSSLTQIIERARRGAIVPVRKDLEGLLGSSLDPRARAMLAQALELSGMTGRIVIEKSTSEVRSVELIRGYTFNVSPGFDVSARRLLEPRVIVADGYIESVSEIHGLLQQAAEAKVALLMFVRGLSDEVRHTLKVNYDRGSLAVIPLVVRFDLEGINSLADIATVVGSDVVSSAKGQLFTSLTLFELPAVASTTVYSDRVVLVNPVTRERVALQINRIRSKRSEERDESVMRLYDLRVKSLSPNQVIIRLPDDGSFVVTSQAMDYVLRGIKALNVCGVMSLDRTPTAAAVSAAFQALQCLSVLRTTGAVVTP